MLPRTTDNRFVFSVTNRSENSDSVTVTHLDFSGSVAGPAVDPLEGDGVELALVQVDHGQLTGLAGRSQGSSQ